MKCVSSPQTNSESRLYPSATSHLNPNHLSYFEFLGRLLGKAVYEVRPHHGPHSSVVQCGAPQSRLVHTVHTHLHCTPVSCVRMSVCTCACCGRTCSSITKLASLTHLIFLQHSSTPSSQCLSPSSAFHPLPLPGNCSRCPLCSFLRQPVAGTPAPSTLQPVRRASLLGPRPVSLTAVCEGAPWEGEADGRGGEGKEEGHNAHMHCLHDHSSVPVPCVRSLPQNYDGDVSDLCLTFSWDEDFMGKVLQWVWPWA